MMHDDLSALPSDDELYDALLCRSAEWEGRAFVGVATTGIFCRLSCPARKPKRENAHFYPSAAACLEAGYRPCKRCRPLALTSGEAEPLVADLLERLEADPARRWSEADLRGLGYDPSTVRRAFKRALGVTFLETARLRRIGEAAKARQEGRPVIEAQLDAGFDSASGFRAAFTKLLGRAPGSMAHNASLIADVIATPLGPMVALADQEALWLLEFADRAELRREIASVEKESGNVVGFGSSPVLSRLAEELHRYFSSQGGAAFQVPTRPYGTPFMQQVHSALKAIPRGQSISYRQLAEHIGRPTAMRAVARANAANRLAIIVPCHRVIAADGSLAGYAGGVWRKEWLLAHENRERPGG